MWPKRDAARVDEILEPCLKNKAELQTVLAHWARSCLQASEGLSLGRGKELAGWPQGVNCQDQAVEFRTGEIQKRTEDSISKSYLKEDTSGQWQGSWYRREPSKAPLELPVTPEETERNKWTLKDSPQPASAPSSLCSLGWIGSHRDSESKCLHECPYRAHLDHCGLTKTHRVTRHGGTDL